MVIFIFHIDTEKQLISSENRLKEIEQLKKEIEQLKMELENTHHTDGGHIAHPSYYIYSLPVSSYEEIEEGIISSINMNYYLYTDSQETNSDWSDMTIDLPIDTNSDVTVPGW